MKRRILASLLLTSTFAWAAPTQVDSKNSKVSFSIHKFKIGKDVPGTFEKFTGTFEVDAKSKLLKSATGEIDAASIETDSGRRNKHLRSEDFFDVKKHPKITFVLKSHTGKPEAGTVKGTLTIKGTPKDVELAAVVVNSDPAKYEINLKGKINRKDYGIIWNEVLDKGGFVLADDVNLELNIKAAAAN